MLVHSGGGTKDEAQRQVAEKEKDYPEPNMFGTTPAHGFFIRHVKGLEIHAMKIEHAERGGAACVFAGGCGRRGVRKDQGSE